MVLSLEIDGTNGTMAGISLVSYYPIQNSINIDQIVSNTMYLAKSIQDLEFQHLLLLLEEPVPEQW